MEPVVVARHIKRDAKVLALGILEWYILIAILALGVAIGSRIFGYIPLVELLVLDGVLYGCFRVALRNKKASYYQDMIQFWCMKKGVHFK